MAAGVADYDAEGNREVANNKNGFIWDLCKRNGVSFRTYGEFADDYKANIPVLEGNFCPYYTSWDETCTRYQQVLSMEKGIRLTAISKRSSKTQYATLYK